MGSGKVDKRLKDARNVQIISGAGSFGSKSASAQENLMARATVDPLRARERECKSRMKRAVEDLGRKCEHTYVLETTSLKGSLKYTKTGRAFRSGPTSSPPAAV